MIFPRIKWTRPRDNVLCRLALRVQRGEEKVQIQERKRYCKEQRHTQKAETEEIERNKI
jgi:hypothetical protein